ncbi:MAG TPA: FAD-binding oxidoreductase [Dehalococcoidia bacterium]|nr:FAD-binding oxidoreductase [Dehalococcoidia bacterium]
MVTIERTVGIDPESIAALKAVIEGEVITAEDASYGSVRQLWNAAFQKFPAVIVRAATTEDVARAVHFANERQAAIAVRSGGHNLAGLSSNDDGVVIDLSQMQEIDIDPDAQRAWVQPGVTSEVLAPATLPHGLVLTTGDAPTVGIGGLTLGGGIGWFVRKYGLTIDHLLDVEVVTADGRVIVANEQQHADLFWAVRGGGGNFGVVTRYHFRLDPTGLVLAGMIALPMTAEAVRGYVDVATAAPEELSTQLILAPAPPAPFVPADMVGTPIAAVVVCWSGDPEQGRKVLAGFSRLAGGPLFEFVDVMPYNALFEFLREPTRPGLYSSTRSSFMRTVEDGLIEALIAEVPPAMSIAQIRVLGGAMARVPAHATAFAHRDKPYMLMLAGVDLDPQGAADAAAWVERTWTRAEAWADGVYVNFLADRDGPARVHEAYPSATYQRLADVKAKYDPENRLRGNQNVRPS